MIRKSLLIALFLAIAFAFPGQARATERSFGGPAWTETFVATPMRATSRFLTRHIDRLVGRETNVTTAAARYIGTNPTGWSHNWCAEFANRVLRRQGYRTSGSAMATSFAHYGPHVAPRPGAIAVQRGHVGFVESVHGDRIVLVSGNGGRRHGARGRVTARNVYSRRTFIAFVMPRRAL